MVIYSTTFVIVPEHDVLVPSFTSKLSRLILVKASSTYSKLVHDSRPYKPIKVSVIKRANDERPIFSTKKEKAILKGGEKYFFNFTFLDDAILNELISNPQFEVKVWGTKFSVELENVSAVDKVSLDDARYYKVLFLTPTLLQPPRFSKKKVSNRYVLFPYTPLLLSSIAAHWNSNMDEKVHGISGAKALYYFREVNYRLKPITTYYSGRPVRGFIGWTIYELTARRNSRLRRNIIRLLAYSNYFGVGKSRAIGFGEVKVTPLNEATDRS
ncbi:MAG: CRISPR-associated endoribonuclease Cas6 [Sulfolobaceae archaeon]|nr:CRISPR-associated endoribonuclease Cas6 [Sulfolobaceae archaeon]